MATISDVLTSIQNGVAALNNFGRQLNGSFNNISSRLAVIDAEIAAIVAAYVRTFNGRSGAVVPVQGDYPTSLIPGTATNDNAIAGNIGEYVESIVLSGSAVALTSGVATNITSISITAGDWDVSGAAAFLPANTTQVTQFVSSISNTSGTLNTNPDRLATRNMTATTFNGTSGEHFTVPTVRFSVNAITTVNLVSRSSFSVSTNGGFGFLRARRSR